MVRSRSPDVDFNASGYPDKTAGTAIKNADRELLKQRRKRVMQRFAEIAAEEGLKISNYVRLTEMRDNDV